jgi:hypothetical protein
MNREQMLFIAYHGIFLISFAVAVLYAWRKISKAQNRSANAWVSPFAYLSLIAWILWVSQYVILVVVPFGLVPHDLSVRTGLWLALMQNALWIIAVLCLHLKLLFRVLLTLPLLVMISIIIVPLVYETSILTYAPVIQIDAVTMGSIFTVLAITTRQLGLSKLFIAVFWLHGFVQGFWRYLWFTPLLEYQLTLFPIWHIALFITWFNLISEMTATLRVMISSTIRDLGQEREAAGRAVHDLNLVGLRSETIGSRPYTPKALCASWAEQCHLFILIIGKCYGHRTRPNGKSAVEFEYDIARKHDPGKILVYEKTGVTREPDLEEFFERLKDFNRGHIISSFATADELYKQIQHDVPQLLASPWAESGRLGPRPIEKSPKYQ